MTPLHEATVPFERRGSSDFETFSGSSIFPENPDTVSCREHYAHCTHTRVGASRRGVSGPGVSGAAQGLFVHTANESCHLYFF